MLEGFRDAASSVPNQIFAVARLEVTVGWLVGWLERHKGSDCGEVVVIYSHH